MPTKQPNDAFLCQNISEKNLEFSCQESYSLILIKLKGKILTMLALAFLDEIFILYVFMTGLTVEPGSKKTPFRIRE